jgi:hypothetical protein
VVTASALACQREATPQTALASVAIPEPDPASAEPHEEDAPAEAPPVVAPESRRLSLLYRACVLGDDGALYEQQDGGLVRLDPERPYQLVSCGQFHGCAVTREGETYCWGYNKDGRVGVGFRSDSEPVTRVDGLEGVTDMAGGARSSCAVHQGLVSCWGDAASNRPERVDELSRIVRVTSSPSEGRCALDEEGRLYQSDFGERHFELQDQLPTLTDVSECLPTSCGITERRSVVCWARNEPPRPVAVDRVTQVAVTGPSACALVKSGGLLCWALGETEPGRPASVELPGAGRLLEVAAAYGQYCVRDAKGLVCFALDDSLEPAGVQRLAYP